MKIKQIIAVVLSFNLTFTNLILAASLEVDRNAALKHQAKLLKSASGIQIIDIVNPDSKGMSHNKFKNYNVNKSGLILNNSKAIVKTQLAGQIAFNSNLRNNAKVILNEVTGTNKSLLNGFTEVAGMRADVIVANPNGITVNGGGFINTNKVTLTTGLPRYLNGYVNGFTINKGDLLIEGDGFNVSDINKVELYSKALILNAKFYAKDLKVVVGDNSVDLDGTITSKESIGSGISIDSSILGGIYANSIELISNDKGVGVTLPPEVIASDKFILDSDGSIRARKIQANEEINIKSRSESINIENSLLSKDININAKNEINIKKDKLLSVVATNELKFQSQVLNNNAYIKANNLTVESEKIVNKGALYSTNNLLIKAKELNNFETIRSNKDIDLLIEDNLNNHNMIYADGDITMAANEVHEKKNTITNNSVIQAEGNINIYAKTFNNKANPVEVKTTSSSSTKKSGSGKNYDLITTTITTQEININTLDPSLVLANKDINIDVETLNNLYSLIASNNDITINATEVNNVGKVVVQATSKVTKRYRPKRYCSRKAGSFCFSHKTKAAYRGSSTSSTSKKTPIVNFGIQAKNSITGNVINLKNASDQIIGALAESEISAKQALINDLSSNSAALQDLSKVLESSADNAIELINTDEDLDTLASKVETPEELVSFKNDLVSFKDNLYSTISSDETTIASLSTTLENIKTNNTANVSVEDIKYIEETIEKLEDNIVLNKQNLIDFEEINALIITKEDVVTNKDALITIENSIQTIYTSNKESLTNLETNQNVAKIVSALENKENILQDQVSVALSLQSDIKYEIISTKEGLYKTNASTSLETVDDTLNSDPAAASNKIFIPSSDFGIFVKVDKPEYKYLIESNPLFTNYKTFLSSNYMLSRLNLNPEKIIKRLGDGMYETNFVRDSIIKATGNRFLDGFSSDLSQFQALMDNAIIEEKRLTLEFGISLSKKQIALLDKDIVWLEEKLVAGEIVLVPQVYLATNKKTSDGVQLTAKNINLNIENGIVNDSLISAKESININAKDITNSTGTIKANKEINLNASNDINNISGNIISEENITLTAKNNIIITRNSTEITNRYKKGEESLTLKGQESLIQAKGNINLDAKKDINIASSKINSNENIAIKSEDGNVNITSLESKEDYSFELSDGYSKGESIKNLASNIEAKNVNINATNLEIKSSNINAKENISLEGVENINILANNDLETTDTKFKRSSGFMGKKTTRDMKYAEKVAASKLNAKNILLKSGNDITLEAAIIKAEENKIAYAKNKLNIVSKSYKEAEIHHTKKSSFGGLIKSEYKFEKDHLKVKASEITADNIILNAKEINIQASKIKANSVEITADILNLLSSKEKLYENEFSNKGGILTATITTDGKIVETVIPATIEVNNKLIFNKQDITSQLETNELIKTLSSQGELSVEQINLIKQYANNDEWHKKTTTLSGLGALIVQAVVTYFTAGAGTALVAGISNAAIQAATQAAIQAVVVQATTSLATAAITGNSPKLDLKNLAKSAITAGVLSYANNLIYSEVGIDPSTELTNTQLVSKTVIDTTTQTAVYGGSFTDNLINNTLNTVSSKAFEYVGHDSIISDNLPAKTVVHSLIGGTVAELQGGDFTAGAISTAVSHVVAEHIKENFKEDIVNGTITQEVLTLKIQAISSTIGVGLALVNNPDLNQNEINKAKSVSDSVVENNSIKLLVTTAKIINKMRKAGKLSTKKIKEIFKEQGLDIIEDGSTLLDPNATLEAKILAAADLLIGTEFNNRTSNIAKNIVNKAEEALKKTNDKIVSIGGKYYGKNKNGKVVEVKENEVGEYKKLKGDDVVGDNLDNHHVPQKDLAKKNGTDGYPKDTNSDTAPAIRIDKNTHNKISAEQRRNKVARSKMSPRDLLADDVKMLKKYGVPSKQIEAIIALNKIKYGLLKGK